jgi:PKD repeat protein
MKKIFTLLLLALSAFSIKSAAQLGTTCNADFNPVFLSSNTVQFNPVMIGDSLTTQHQWNFGDGSLLSAIPSPTHTYAAGTYTVKHLLKKINPNGVFVCMDSVFKIISVQSTSCNLVANFAWNIDSLNWQSVHYQNTSTPSELADSVRWTFGDNSPPIAGVQSNSSIANPTHIYANAGTYTVCLRVKKNITVAGSPSCVKEICKAVTVQSPTTCNLVSYFTNYADSLNAQKIWFTNQSTGAAATDSIRWSFGDGTYSNVYSPYHYYAQSGTYTVCLRIIKRNNTGALTNCISEFCKQVIVQAQTTCTLQAYFSYHADSLNSQKIWFTNQTQGGSNTDSIRWSFGDGTASNINNPDHTYAQPGTYTVCLRVIKRNASGGLTTCISEFCKQVTVIGQPTCSLHANFTSYADTGNAQKIWFNNTSAGATSIDSIRWSFGDGTYSNLYNPNYHFYTQPGTYTVCLRIIKRTTAGVLTTCISDTCKVIIVQSSCNFTANWSWRADSANALKIYFTNQTLLSNAGVTAVWSFGDGISATSWNAVHEYAQPGKYRVCLKVYLNSNCFREKCDSITVLPPSPPCNSQSYFIAEKFSTDNQKYKFTPAYQNPAAVYSWSFGDGTGSNDMIATHRYSYPGNYNVCLTVWRNANCVSTTCKTITVTAQIDCNAIQVSYNYQKDPFVPNKVYFYAISNFPILDQTWTIRKWPLTASGIPVILHQNNPVYVFQDSGYYQVCLRAITLGGCIKEYCNIIHIERPANTQCILQAYPNPASSTVNVNVLLTQPEMIHTYVYNLLNVLVKEKHQQGSTGNNVVTLSIGDLVPGMYNMQIVYGNKTCTSKFQKL